MKATERQQLTHNELAEALLLWWTQAKPYLAYVLIGALVVAVAVFFYYQSGQHKKADQDKAMIEFLPTLNGQTGGEAIDQLTMQINSLDGYIRKFPTSPLATVTKLCLANRYYDRAIFGWAEPAGKTRENVKTDFQEAKRRYEELASRHDDIGLEGRFGLASVAAELGDQDPALKKDAENQFLTLAKENPNTSIETRANERLKILREAQPLEFAPEVPELLKPAAVPSGAAAVKAPAKANGPKTSNQEKK
jgi:hypothetical protein